MRNLLFHLITAQRHELADHSQINISAELDREALHCYEQAQAQVAWRCRGKQKDPVARQGLLVETLSVNLTKALSFVNLQNPAFYAQLMKAVEYWCPWQVEARLAAPLVQEVLLAILPDMQKRQRLEKLCGDYKNHLSIEITGHLKSDHPALYAQYAAHKPRVFGAPPFECGEPRALAITSEYQPLEQSIAEQASKLPNPGFQLTAVIQKYQAITVLENTLKTPIKSVSGQLTDFRRQFHTQQVVIAKDRDSMAIKFVKGVATLLSIGLAALLGIWGVKGKTAANEIRQVLITPAQS